VPTSHRRHSITETPELAAVLEPLRRRMGKDTPPLAELLLRGAELKLREVEAQERARKARLATFVERLSAAPPPDLEEFHRIRHHSREP